MKNRIIILVFFVFQLSYSQEVKLLDIIYKEEFKYTSFYHKKTVIFDQIDPSKNISLITDSFLKKKKILTKCKKRKCYPLFDKDTLVSLNFRIPKDIRSKLLKEEIFNKIDNVYFSQKKIKKKRQYTIYTNNFKNVFIVVLEMTKSYYNTHSIELKLCDDSSDRIILYRILNAFDEEQYFK